MSCQIVYRPTPEMLKPAPNSLWLDSEGFINFWIGYCFTNSCYIAIVVVFDKKHVFNAAYEIQGFYVKTIQSS